jgi:hypothetical protein
MQTTDYNPMPSRWPQRGVLRPFLGHLVRGFHRVAALFRVFTVARGDERQEASGNGKHSLMRRHSNYGFRLSYPRISLM